MKHPIAISLFFFVSFFLFLHPIDSGDFFHHIITGRFIVEHGSLPSTDTFTFSAYGKPWVAHSWGSGLLYYLTYLVGGVRGVNILLAAIGAATVGVLFLLAKKYTQLSGLILSFLSLTGILLSLYWPSRPMVWAPLFLSVLLLFLTSSKRFFYLIPVLFFLWSILYGASSLLGLVIFGLFLLSLKERWTKKNILVFTSAVAASCLNGYGIQSLFYGVSGSAYLQSQDWFPLHAVLGQQLLPNVSDRILGYGIWVTLIIILLFYLFSSHRHFFKSHVFESLLLVGILAPFFSFRYIPLVPILSLPFLFLSFQLLPKKMTHVMLWSTTALCVIFLMFRFSHFPTGLGILNEKSLSDITTFMRQHRIFGNVYTSQDLGAYVTWTMPESKVFYDTRDDLFVDTSVVKDLDTVNNGTMQITKLLDKYQATIVIGRPHLTYRPLTQSPAWKIVYFKDNYFIAIRR